MSEQQVRDRGLAAEQHTGAYVLSGLLLLLYGLVPAAWTAYTLIVRETPFEDFLLAVVWPSRENYVMAMTPYEWAFAVALIVVGAVALARRRAARGGALLFSMALLGVSVRETVGMFDDDYRHDYFASDEGPWLLATRLFGLVVGGVVLGLMLRARDDRERRGRSGFLLAAGGVLVFAGLFRIGGLLVEPRMIGDYLLGIVDPTEFGPNSMMGGVPYYHATITVALLVVGVLALNGRLVARGAGLALLPVVGYLGLVGLAPISEYVALDVLFASVASFFALGEILVALLAALVGIPLLAMASAQDEQGGMPGLSHEQPTAWTTSWTAGENSGTAGLPTVAGDVGEQHPRGD